MEIRTKEYAELWEKELKNEVLNLSSKPTLVIIMAKDYHNPSAIYVNNKINTAKRIGIEVKLIEINGWQHKTKNDLLIDISEIIDIYDHCSIICQLPFPKLSESEIANLIPVEFDVDGFTTYQKGLLAAGDKNALVSCTALGVMKMLKYMYNNLEGKSIAIINRSNLIGKPLLQLALQNDMTPTIIHSKTHYEEKSLALSCSTIVVTGCGKRKIFNENHFNPDYVQTIIDCSMDKVEGIKGVGDCDKERIISKHPSIDIASGYGHTGIMTVLGLCENVIKAHKNFIMEN